MKNLMVESDSVGEGSETKGPSVMGRLSAKLFNEEFWTTEATGRATDKE